MTTISKDSQSVTLINVFTVDPANQAQLIALLKQATESAILDVPGFISAALHRSLDGSKVTMYAQWQSAEAYDAMRKRSGPTPFLEQAMAIATFSPGMYEVVETFESTIRP
jgi:quinol monooxygenase YgiN